METRSLRLGELFSGPGGLALGAVNATSRADNVTLKIRHVWACDIDSSACETYRCNICRDVDSQRVICTDVRELNINDLGSIDVFAYGFPCNDFSIVGEHKGVVGKYGRLYYYGVKVLNFFKPIVFVAENVGGIHSANNGKAFQQILSDLESAGDGYNLTVHLYKSEQYGVPQTRHRYIIVGFRRDTRLFFKVPAPTHIEKYVTAKEALSNIPTAAKNNERARTTAKVIERLKQIKPGENAWTADLDKHLRLNVKAVKLSHIYRRLQPDKPSYTITGSGGGGTHVYHYHDPRPLTNRERARLQSFPDEFYFCGSREQVRKQIGMAVPPKLSTVIFTAILHTLNGVEYSSVPANFPYHSAPSTLWEFRSPSD